MTTPIFRRILTHYAIGRRKLHTTVGLSCFYRPDPKSGYKTMYYNLPAQKNWTIFGRISDGYYQLKRELGIWVEEIKEKLRNDPILVYTPNEVDVVWEFNGDPSSLDQWILTCDSDYDEGFSTATLEMSSTGTGIFSGTLSTQLPKDGKIKHAGYCNITTKPKEKSFRRTIHHDWSRYTHVVLRVRGDGRTYGLNIGNKSFYDLTWNDLYHYPFYTRGGPYWQLIRIPFSKFVFSSRGRIQDDQNELMLHEVSNLGITVADDVNGNFRLEIAYVGLESDHLHTEVCAYENYNVTGIRF
ncbi:hypothetical protein DMN91_007241 [Ooceraea biroi]|uniref:Putative complex I intermediate-associated protein 30, mitochondrial n=1 Tax=Ooceraea biroi TaxID=2015173 RepID=A0A026WF33_OOCBI|nr:complex I intermediate-associated protein 30, mitochondrial [Ooceraea biroi]EZA54652.1 putative complex I intermediate-associated protein 30, mitochondrial [Ooceraea biroi]RLU20628.1 hypothetical protein DMN91_007241 [Ooceraea biroi]